MVSRNLLRQLDSFSEGIEAELLTVFPVTQEWLPAEVEEFWRTRSSPGGSAK